MPQATSSFRPDIDGLRAVAVLAVLAHHVVPGALPGGFVGVDIFFVISGFLVTRLIDDDLQAGRFRFAEFLWKRCRRILPALLTLLAGTLVLGACVLTGPEMVSLARHVGAGSVSASNLLLWSEVGYFDEAASLKPLLHLWSLGVEEQFYVVWPLFLSMLPLARRTRILAVAAAVVASLLVSETLAYADPAQAFYLLHSRAWELGAGGLLALVAPALRAPAFLSDTRRTQLGHVTSAIGLALLTFALANATSGDSWPGIAALAPVVGTVLVIAAGPTALPNASILSSAVARWFGQRSYALYLWHWPPLAMLHIIAQERGWSADDGVLLAALLMVPVTLLADLTYRCIERPVRHRTSAITARQTITMRHLAPYGAVLAAGVMVSVTVVRAHGFPSRYGTLAGTDAMTVLRAASPDSITAYDRNATRCRLADKGTATWCWRVAGHGRGVAVIGDSHAEVVFAGLVAQRPGMPLFLTGRKGCAPITQYTPIADRTGEICRRASLLAHDAIVADTSIATVLIVSRGPAYITGTGFGIDSLRPVVPVAVGASLSDAYERGIDRAIRSFTSAGKRVMLVTGVPEIGFLPAECVIGRPFRLRTVRTPCALPREAFDQRNAAYRALVRRVADRNPGLDVVDASPLFCDTEQCRVTQNDHLLYQDGNHLTLTGSRLIATALTDRLVSPSLASRPD